MRVSHCGCGGLSDGAGFEPWHIIMKWDDPDIFAADNIRARIILHTDTIYRRDATVPGGRWKEITVGQT